MSLTTVTDSSARLLERAEAIEVQFEQLASAEELNDEALGELLEKRDHLHREMGEQVSTEKASLSHFRPLFKRAYDNTQTLLARCQDEQSAVKEQLLTLNTSKKARKAY